MICEGKIYNYTDYLSYQINALGDRNMNKKSNLYRLLLSESIKIVSEEQEKKEKSSNEQTSKSS